MKLFKAVLLSASTFAFAPFIQAGDSAMADLESRLDKGGSVIFMVDGRDSFQTFGSLIESKGDALAQLAGGEPEARQNIKKAFRVLAAAYRASGFAEIDAYGFSSKRSSVDGLYSFKSVLRCPPDKNSGFLWRAFGRKPSDLSSVVSMMPPSSSFATFSDFDAVAFRSAFKDALRKEHANSALGRIETQEAEAKANGFDVDAIASSFDGRFAFVFSLDWNAKIKIPSMQPGKNGMVPKFSEIPTPGVVIYAKVKNDLLFDAIAAKNPSLKRADRSGAKVLEGTASVGAPFVFQVSLVRKGDWLLFSSSPALSDSVMAAMDGGPSLAGTDAFKRLSSGVSLDGNAFVYYDNAVMKALSALSPAMGLMRGANFDLPKFAEFAGLDSEVFKVMRSESPSCVCWRGNASNPGLPFSGESVLSSVTVAGMLLPAMNSSREKARRISDASNLKQIGLAIKQYSLDNHDRFPEKSGADGFEMLRSGSYLTDVKIFLRPGSSKKPAASDAKISEDNTSYVYLGGFTESVTPDMPIAFDKPGESRDGFVNILFADGHVQGFNGWKYASAMDFAKLFLEREGKSFTDEAKNALLEKAMLYDMAGGN